MANNDRCDDDRHEIEYSVDGEPEHTAKRVLTVREILKRAGLDPKERCLVLIKGKKQFSYRDRLDEDIRMHPGMKFVTVFCGPVPVS